MTLDDLMHGQNAVLLRYIKGEVELTKFVEVSLGLAQGYVDLHEQAYGGMGYIKEIVTDVRQYRYNGRVERLLDRNGIKKRDKERHITLARWYNEFFVKYYVLTQTEDMQPYLEGLRKVIEDGDILKLLEIVSVFNESIRLSGIRDVAMCLLDLPDKGILMYCEEGPQKYKDRQMVKYRS